VPASWLARSRSLGTARAFRLGHQPAAELEVLAHAHLRKQAPPFGDQRDAGLHDLVRLVGQVVAIERHHAAARDQTGERLQQRALAGAVGAEDHREAGLGFEMDVAQHEERPVAGAQATHLQVRAAAAAEHEWCRAPIHHAATSSGSAISSPR
jgi:hypothetical protein